MGIVIPDIEKLKALLDKERKKGRRIIFGNK